MQNIDMLWQIGLPIVGSLTGAVVFLWKSMHSYLTTSEKRLNKKLAECETKHEERDMWAVNMSEKVGKLEGLMEGHKQAREDLKKLSDQVIILLNK